MHAQKGISLQPINTFGIDASAQLLYHIGSNADIFDFLEKNISTFKIIGGGSNILLTGDQPCILKNEIKGIKIIEEDDDYALVEVGAGESWHGFVLWALAKELGGLENLSLIPGSVGAAPMQNIGAYGVEQEQVFDHLLAINLHTKEVVKLDKAACRFGYRESIFKNELKDQYFIVQVVYRLSKSNHKLNLEYGAIRDVLRMMNITNPTIRDISDAVIAIRKSKLPDPEVIGNAGSFFKNPVITPEHYSQIASVYPDIVSYKQQDGMVKIPAGWLIEKAGFKGLKKGHIGVHKDQALVLVNYGGGTGQEILLLAEEIQEKINSMFSIKLNPEVNIW